MLSFNAIKKTTVGLFLVTLMSVNSILPIVVHVQLLERVNPVTGVKQQVYLLGDDHEPEFFAKAQELREKIKARIVYEQDQIIAWAKAVNALVLVEDMFEHEPIDGLFNRIILAAPRFAYNCFLKLGAPDYFLAHFMAKCRARDIKTLSIEPRHNAIALLGFSYLLAPAIAIAAYNWQTVKAYPKASGISAALIASYIASCVYGIRHQYNAIKHDIDQSKYKDNINNYWKDFPAIYAEKDIYELPIFRKTFAWVAVKAVTAILNNATQKTFFVCAGTTHCYNVQQALQAEGFKLKEDEFNKKGERPWDKIVNLNELFDIDTYMKSTCPPIA